MRPAGNNFGRPSFGSRPSFDKKPAFGGGSDNNQQFKQQLELLNSKLDKILDALTSRAAPIKAEVEATPKAEAKKAKSAVKKLATKKKK